MFTRVACTHELDPHELACFIIVDMTIIIIIIIVIVIIIIINTVQNNEDICAAVFTSSACILPCISGGVAPPMASGDVPPPPLVTPAASALCLMPPPAASAVAEPHGSRDCRLAQANASEVEAEMLNVLWHRRFLCKQCDSDQPLMHDHNLDMRLCYACIPPRVPELPNPRGSVAVCPQCKGIVCALCIFDGDRFLMSGEGFSYSHLVISKNTQYDMLARCWRSWNANGYRQELLAGSAAGPSCGLSAQVPIPPTTTEQAVIATTSAPQVAVSGAGAWFSVSDGGTWCNLCWKWVDQKHLKSRRHLRRIQNPDDYLKMKYDRTM